MSMHVDDFDSLILYVGDLSQARAFYADRRGLPVRVEDEIIVVVGGPRGRSCCIGTIAAMMTGGSSRRVPRPVASVRLKVKDPDAWEQEARQSGVPVLWPTQEATWGRSVVVADPDGRPVALAKMAAR